MKRKIHEIISMIDEVNEDAVVYAKRIEGEFKDSSETVLLELTEEEQELPTAEIARLKCPGFDYFLEVFLIKELLEDFLHQNPRWDFNQKVERVIYYAEFDAYKFD